ncbi:MAG: AAA family ATPase [Alphaproteobacteria bacterium]|jgi:predicted ABC-type ATPase|nr:AAA family ATPase [Alphaproteobacteria bacterium]
MAKAKPWMIVIAGPNGAGKSTFYDQVLKDDPFFKKAEFINLDNEAKELAGEDGDVNDFMFEAGRNIRNRLREKMEKKQTFIYETTASGRTHLKLIEMAKEEGFNIASIFIGLSSAHLSYLRVQQRVRNGGHDVATDDIERRFPNIMKRFPDMLRLSDVSMAFDNSKKTPYELIFMMDERKLLVFHTYPKWMNTALKGRKTRKDMVHITKEDFLSMNDKKRMDMTKRIFKSLEEVETTK